MSPTPPTSTIHSSWFIQRAEWSSSAWPRRPARIFCLFLAIAAVRGESLTLSLRLSVYAPSFSLSVRLQGQPNQRRNQRRNAASLVVHSQDWPVHATQIHILPSAVKASRSSGINAMQEHFFLEGCFQFLCNFYPIRKLSINVSVNELWLFFSCKLHVGQEAQ